jgi:outer membrane protein assembly factor BamB
MRNHPTRPATAARSSIARHSSSRRPVLGLVLALVVVSAWQARGDRGALAADAWPRLRGVEGTGRSPGVLPADWETRPWVWAIDLPGIGHASPVVWGGRVIAATADPDTGMRRLTSLLIADGSLAWQVERPGDVYHIHQFSSLASSTPAVGDAGIFWMRQIDGRVVLEALGHDGASRWQVDLGEFPTQHGFGSSPAVWNDLVIVPLESDGPSRVVALDAATGREIWSLPRETSRTAYSTPLVLDGPPPLVILTGMAHGVSGVDALTGRLLWERRCLPRRAVSSPVIAAKTSDGPLALATCGDGGGNNLLVALRVPAAAAAPPDAPADGGAVEPPLAWTLDRSVAPYVPTPLVTPAAIYLWSDRGVVSRVEPAEGKVAWRGRVGGNYFASPISLGSGVVNISSDGDMVLVADAAEFRVLGTRALEEVVRASPAAAEGRLIVRTAGRLLALPLAQE